VKMWQAGIASSVSLSGLGEVNVLYHPILRSSLGYCHKKQGFVSERLNCGALCWAYWNRRAN